MTERDLSPQYYLSLLVLTKQIYNVVVLIQGGNDIYIPVNQADLKDYVNVYLLFQSTSSAYVGLPHLRLKVAELQHCL